MGSSQRLFAEGRQSNVQRFVLCFNKQNIIIRQRREMCFQVVPFIPPQIHTHVLLPFPAYHCWDMPCTGAWIVLPQSLLKVGVVGKGWALEDQRLSGGCSSIRGSPTY